MTTVVQNTLYITAQGAAVSREHESLVVRLEKVERLRIPRRHVAGLVCFGRVWVSPEAMAACAEEGIGVTFLSESGRYLARVEGTHQGGIVLRRLQHRVADDPAFCSSVVRSIIAGKVANTRAFVQRAVRDGDGAVRVEGDAVLDALARVLSSLERAEDVDAMRGLEGDAAARYFGWLPTALRARDEGVVFRGRSRRPPRDPVNAMLSFGYALLLHDCVAALASAGLDPDLGFLHSERPGRPSLALDSMEELRIPFVDRMVVAMVNLGQIRAKDFVERDGGFEMSESLRKAFLVEYQARKRDEVTHPYTGVAVRWGLVPQVQARLLARSIRGELRPYPPFLLK
ncbi:MAG: type I-C CRISPR-associated endonuclease Cas1 [Deltaproteobacteria bacterium]|nr:type I-C CRISPR-associated endonuclease Cas1 [Deltaproteobacteria bacterium]